MRSWTTPTDDQVNHAVALLVHKGQRRYFFDKLENPAWIRFLAEKGFFRSPPAPVPDEEKQTVGLPPWPESGYLTRMAVYAPEEVIQVIRKIPKTENVRVHEDFVQAALAMPAPVAARMVNLTLQWLRMQHGSLLAEKAGDLMAYLARGGEVNASLKLARWLLSVLPSRERETARVGQTIGLHVPREPVPRFSGWQYGEIVRVRVPVLVEVAGQQALEALCDALNAAVAISREQGDAAKPVDHSFIWRPAIGSSADGDPNEVLNILVSAVRDSAESIVAVDAAQLTPIIQTLERRGWFVFRRVAMYTLARFPEPPSDLVTTRLTDRSAFDEPEIRHEYAALLRSAFPTLPLEGQETILDWIKQGPDLERVRARRQPSGEPLSDDELDQYALVWTRDRLSWIGDALPPAWEPRYRELVDAYGEPEHPDLPFWKHSDWVGTTSPKTQDELRAMAGIDVVRFLKSWRPPDDPFMGPSPEGLGRALTDVVSSNPRPYALIAAFFRGLDPTYVRALIAGLRETVKAKTTFDWAPVLALCRSIVTSPWPIEPGIRRAMERDLDWSATNQSIAELLSNGLEQNAIPISLRQRVWDVLGPLTDDSEPTPEYEAQYGGSNMDPLTLSINTARGEAMHAVVRYALWIRRTFDRETHEMEGESRLLTFDSTPEVKAVLERHLDPKLDPAVAVRAVYGQWFPWLVLLDAEWTSGHLEAIFPVAPELKPYWNAAWETYLFYSKLYENVFVILSKEYNRAVNEVDAPIEGGKLHSDKASRLGEHLMVMYGRGKLELSDPDGLVSRFLDRASERAREAALEFVGRSMQGDVPLDPEVALRFQALWANFLSTAASGEHVRELNGFGWWFVSGKLDETWSLTQLLNALNLGVQVEPDHLVVKRLGSIAQSMPSEAVECLRLMAQGDKEGWRIYRWRGDARAILAAGLSSSHPIAQKTSRDLINWFGARGIHDFRDLIS
jgi:hypothetical protein